MSKSGVRLLLVLIALLLGAVAALAACLAVGGGVRRSITYGSGVFAGTTLFVLEIENYLGLFN